MKLINQEKFNEFMKSGLNALQKPNGIIRVSRKPISITQEDATNWKIPYKLHKEKHMEQEPKWFTSFRKENDKRWDMQFEFNKRIELNITQINNRLDNIESDVALMKNTPTMKKELNI